MPDYHVERVRLTLHVGEGQGPPVVVAELEGTVAITSGGQQGDPQSFAQTLELELQDGRYLIVASRGGDDLLVTGPAVAACGGRPRRRPARGRRAPRRARLPARRLPLQDLRRSGGDDGRRGLLARLRRRRLARPLRGQLASDPGRRRPLEGARRAAAQRAVPQREGQVRRREPRLRRRPAAARERLRGRGLQRRPAHRPLRHGSRVRRVALEPRWGEVRRGRERRRHRHLRLAYRRVGRRRERRRPAGPLRGRLRGRQRPGPRLGASRSRRTSPASATASTSTTGSIGSAGRASARWRRRWASKRPSSSTGWARPSPM